MGSSGTYDGPSLTEPALGRSLTTDGDLAYRKRASAERQAAHWNAVLVHDPVLGLESGFQVGVTPLTAIQSDGPRWELIWVPTASASR